MPKVNIVANKRYMMSESFWQDPHNKEMGNLSKRLYNIRKDLSTIVELQPKDFYQNEQGFVLLKKRNRLVSFFSISRFEKMFVDSMNNECRNILCKMSQLSVKAKKGI